MDYVEMIKDPQLVLGFQELIVDADPVVVKRTVKVFTSVYHHTLRLLSSGELEEETLMKSWTSVKEVVNTLLGMIKRCDNEGVLIHLLRFLEAAVMSHLMYDLTDFPLVFERGREVVKTGLKALKDHVTTPYVGGSAFIVGVRALVSIACLRPDLWEPVTDLLKKQLTSLPPTLFDHNVRSLNKTLQRNLFRLLRRAETPDLKRKLIEMMVGVGVPRKVIMPWAPTALEARKRGPEAFSDEVFLERNFPPNKKSRETTEQNPNEKPISPPPSKSPPSPSDPRLAPLQDPRKPLVQSPPPKPVSPPTNAPPVTKASNADLMFLTSLIPTSKAPVAPQTKEPLTLEKELCKQMNFERVCSLVINNIEKLPEEEPKGFRESFEKAGEVLKDTEAMRKRLSTILSHYLSEFNISTLSLSNEVKLESKAPTCKLTEDSTESNLKELDKLKEPSNSSSASSTPSSTPPLADTDLRQVYPRPARSMGDVDMRIADPRLRDPRMLKDPRIRKDFADPRLNYSESRETRVDPRISNKPQEVKPRLDPRLPKTNSTKKNSEPRKTRWDPRTPAQDTSNQQNSPPSVDISVPLRSLPEGMVPGRPNDPRINRSQSQGLLPHPDLRTFQQETIDPRLQHQNQGMNDPRVQQQQQQQQQQPPPLPNFPTQPFQFGPMNPFSHPFMNGLSLPTNSMPPSMMGGPPFNWQNNLRNPPPPLLVAQTLASVQSGMLPPTMINL